MKSTSLVALSVAFLAVAGIAGAVAQDQQQRVPPGIVDAQRSQAKTRAEMPPPLAPHRDISPQELSRNAAELSRLAQQIPAEVEALNKGVLNKDLESQLKQIENLSKKLRQEVRP